MKQIVTFPPLSSIGHGSYRLKRLEINSRSNGAVRRWRIWLWKWRSWSL